MSSSLTNTSMQVWVAVTTQSMVRRSSVLSTLPTLAAETHDLNIFVNKYLHFLPLGSTATARHTDTFLDNNPFISYPDCTYELFSQPHQTFAAQEY